MDNIFQVTTNQTSPIREGSILIASPLLNDYHFVRSVILMVANDAEGSLGIVMNKRFKGAITLSQLIPDLEGTADVPVYQGGPVDPETLFFIHTFSRLDGALPLGGGLFLNGDFDFIKDYIGSGLPTEGCIRFFTGYAGWGRGQLQKEIDGHSWIIGNSNPQIFLRHDHRSLWKECMNDLGDPYRFWAKYPLIPSLN